MTDRAQHARNLLWSSQNNPLATRICEMELPSVANVREHFHARAKRTAAHRGVGHLLAQGIPMPGPNSAFLVVLTRCGPRPLDSDNLASAFKGIRDGVARRIGVDDGDPRITWHYEQFRAKQQSVRLDFWVLPTFTDIDEVEAPR